MQVSLWRSAIADMDDDSRIPSVFFVADNLDAHERRKIRDRSTDHDTQSWRCSHRARERSTGRMGSQQRGSWF